MKALRYLLIAFTVVMASVQIVNAKAQTLAQEPSVQFQSTSSMVGSGSALPQAAVEGTATTYDTNEGSERPNSGIRKERPGDWSHPVDDPIGDGIGLLALFACAFAFGKWIARRTKPLR